MLSSLHSNDWTDSTLSVYTWNFYIFHFIERDQEDKQCLVEWSRQHLIYSFPPLCTFKLIFTEDKKREKCLCQIGFKLGFKAQVTKALLSFTQPGPLTLSSLIWWSPMNLWLPGIIRLNSNKMTPFFYPVVMLKTANPKWPLLCIWGWLVCLAFGGLQVGVPSVPHMAALSW